MNTNYIHFNQKVEKREFAKKLEPILRDEFTMFYQLGMQEQANNIRPQIELLKANITNVRLGDKEFRTLVGTVVDALLEEV